MWRRHRHFPVFPFCATSAHAGGYWMCNTGSVFDPSERKIFAAGATALKSCGRIGRNGASGSATNENDPFWGGFSGFGQAERAAEPPRGPRIESPAPPSEPPTALRPACGAPLPDPRSPQPVLAARDLATPPLAGRTAAYKPASKNRSLILQRNARAIRTSVSTVGFCSPRSIRPTKFRWQSTFSANSSWDNPKARRRILTAAPNFRHSFGIGLFMLARTSEWYILLYTREMYIPRRGGP